MRTLISFLILLLWGFALCVGVLWYGMGGDRAAREIGERLSSPEDGIRVSVDRAGLAPLPVPHIRLSGIVVRIAPAPGRPEVSVYAERCVVRPVWKDLFSGSARLASVRLVRPTAVVMPVADVPQAKDEYTAPSEAPPNIPELLSGLRIEVVDGRLEVRGNDRLRLEGLNGEAVLPTFAEQRSGGRSTARLNLRLEAVDWTCATVEPRKATANRKARQKAQKDQPAAKMIPATLRLRNLDLDVSDVWFAAAHAASDGAASPPSADAPASLLESIAEGKVRVSLDVASLLASNTETTTRGDPCRLQCAARLGRSAQGPTLVGEITLRGDLPLKGYPTPADLRIPFTFEPAVPDPTASLSGALTDALSGALPQTAPHTPPASAGKTPGDDSRTKEEHTPVQPIVRIDGASLTLDGAAAVFTGRFLPGRIAAFLPAFRNATGTPGLEGSLEVSRVSIPRWFGFARLLPDGLRDALDAVRGTLTFTLTPDALTLSSLHASAGGMTLEGTGGIPKMSQPIMTLNVRTPEVDLDALFPELSGRAVTKREYAMPPLVDAAPDEDQTDNADDVGFDIRLAGDHVRWKRVSAKGLTFRATPVPPQEGDGVRLNVGLASCYNGTVNATVWIGKDVRLSCALRGLDSEKPITLLSGAQRFGGVVSANVDLRRNGGFGVSAADFFQKAHGSWEITAKNGFWMQDQRQEKGAGTQPRTQQGGAAAKQERQSFEKIVLAFQGQGMPAEPKQQPDTVTCSGSWLLDMKVPDWQAALRLNGALSMSMRTGVSLAAVKTQARLSALRDACQLTASGIVSFNTAASTFACTDMRGDLRPSGMPSAVPATVSGNAEMTPAKDGSGQVFSGRFSLASPALRPFLRDNIPADTLARLPQEALRALNVSGSFLFSDKEFRLNNLQGRLDDTSFSGTVTRQAGSSPGGLPRWTVDARFGDFDLDRYMPRTPARRDRRDDRPTDFTRVAETLKQVEASGSLSFDHYTVYKIRHDRLTVPFTLRQGMLTADPVRASVFGGRMGAGFQAEALPRPVQKTATSPAGLRLRLRYTLNGMDMLALCRARKMDISLSGSAFFEGDFNGAARTSDDIPKAFNGTWAFSVKNGAIRSSTDVRDTPVTRFLSLSGSGPLTNGVVSNNNLLLAGDTVSATGRGTLDLVRQTLDYRLNISAPGVPDIPVRYYGSLDKPERSIGAARAITGTLTNIGSGVLNLLEGAVTAPLRLLRP